MKIKKSGLCILLACLSLHVVAEDIGSQDSVTTTLNYDRVYTDNEGISHYGSGEITFEFKDYAVQGHPVGVHVLQNAKGATLLFNQKSTFQDWHPAPRRQFVFVLQGTIESQVADGEVRRYGPGDMVLLEDTTGKGHTTRILDQDSYVLMLPVTENGGTQDEIK